MKTCNFLLLLIGACVIADAMEDEKGKWRTGLCKCITKPKPICEPKTTKPQDCNTCTCSENGMVWDCTKKKCPPKVVCDANKIREIGRCKTCTCNGDGTVENCTECCDGDYRLTPRDADSCEYCDCVENGHWGNCVIFEGCYANK